MGWRTTLALAVLLALTAAVVYRDVVHDDPDATWESLFRETLPTPPSADIEPLLDFAPAAVAALSVRRGDARISTRRSDDGWSDVRDPRLIDDYVASLAELAVVRRLDGEPSAAELAGYGLAPARAEIDILLSSGRNVRLLLGDPTPTATGSYCRLGDSGPVFVTGALARWDLDRLMRAAPPTPPAG